MSKRFTDRMASLEMLLAPPAAKLARMFAVPVSLRLLDDYDAVVAKARAACGQSLAPDAVPLLTGSEDEWSEYAQRAQARLIAEGAASMAGVVERESERQAAVIAAQQPPPQRKAKPAPEFIHYPNPFARA